jgi:hypothetical protein
MRTMFDSTTPSDCPAGGDLYLYYCDGLYATTEAAVLALFPNAIPVPVSAIGTNAGVVGDCEPGCMTPAQLVDWVLMRRAAGLDPTGYVNELKGWPGAKAAFAVRGVPEPHWGVADYDGDPTIPPGAVFKQFRGSFRTPPAGTGAHYDQSSVVDHWPGVDGVYGPGGGSLGGDTMNATDFKALLIAAIHGTGQEFDYTQADVDNAAAEYAGGRPADAIIAEVVNAPKGVAYKKAVADLLAGVPGSGTLVPHTHAIPSTQVDVPTHVPGPKTGPATP